MRDDFPMQIKEILAKRVAFHCSNPQCRQSTSGPQQETSGIINIGVAAHITAASDGGPRYDPSITSEQRRTIDNGIWLCQNCTKLVDNDPDFYDEGIPQFWKSLAEKVAAKELEQGRPLNPDAVMFARLEELMPDLLKEMREDLKSDPSSREFILFKTNWHYNSDTPYLVYYYENYPDLDNYMHILENNGLIRDIQFNSVKRYVINERLA